MWTLEISEMVLLVLGKEGQGQSKYKCPVLLVYVFVSILLKGELRCSMVSLYIYVTQEEYQCL